MSQVRKTSGTPAARGVVYDLETRRRERAAALTAAESAPDVRAEKIAELKARIASGQYNPDPMEIARELVNRGF